MESHTDILYENQRGAFLCGIPRFSSNSLWQLDPSAWVDALFKPSAVNPHNAQVPDPSWHWAWPTWYVDMSRDVDEEGWEYSFWFVKKFPTAWHGTHPWFHSFVRRRRWIRMRKRNQHDQKVPEMEAHAMNADYFTIHSKRAKSPGDDDDDVVVKRDSRYEGAPKIRPDSTWGAKTWKEQEDDVELSTVPALRKALRKATIDRERIALVRKFLNEAGEELHYLTEEIPHIMSMLVFQTSRRQLLSILMEKHQELDEQRWKTADGSGQTDEAAERLVENLKDAMRVADEQCKKLEYWSDVKSAVVEGDTLSGVDEEGDWSPELDQSGPDPDAVPDRNAKGKGQQI